MVGTPVHSRRIGFTLVEVLVVVGIVAALLGITLPALAKARSVSHEVRCAALLRQWGAAFHAYAAENNGVFPHSGDRTRNPFAFRGIYCPAFPQNESSYLYVLPPLMGDKSWAKYPNGQKPTGGIFQCPLAEMALADTSFGYAPSYWGYHSFCMNMYLDADRPGSTPPGVDPYPSFLNLAQAKSASQTILLYETTLDPGKAYGQTGYPGTIQCLCGMYPNDGPANFGDRHPHQAGKLGGNVVFLDGHLEWRDHVWEPSYPNPAMPPIAERLWWPY